MTAVVFGFEESLLKLAEAENFAQKEAAIEELSNEYKNDERLTVVFSQMLSGALYKTAQNSLVYQNGADIIDILTGQKLEISESQIEKITINNKLRNVLRSKLTVANLASKNVKTRLNAAKELLLSVNEKDYELLKDLTAKESDKKIKEVLSEALSVLNAKFKSGGEQQKAIIALGDSLSPVALQTLNELNNIENMPYKKETAAAIQKIENSKKFYSILETLYFGLSAGSILLLAAMGLAITFGVMRVINMAHGELIMLGAYTTYTIQQIMPNFIEYSVIIAIPIAFLISALAGILIERLVLRHLYTRPLEALLATFGISLLLQQFVRTVYSPLNKEVKTPEWMSGSFEINSILSLTYNRFYIIIFALMVFAFALFVMKKTSLGLKVRAVSQNRSMAQAMGIKTNLVDALTFGIGSGIAGIAGVALSQLTNVGPNLGQAYIVDSFMVVVFGGVGNLWGTLIGAFTLGEINKIIEPLSGAVLAKVIILIVVILFIQKRPRGLFPQKGRDAEE